MRAIVFRLAQSRAVGCYRSGTPCQHYARSRPEERWPSGSARDGHRSVRPAVPRSHDRKLGRHLGHHSSGDRTTCAFAGSSSDRLGVERRRAAGLRARAKHHSVGHQSGHRHRKWAEFRGAAMIKKRAKKARRALARALRTRRKRRGVALILVLAALTVLTVMLTEIQDESSAEFGSALSRSEEH